MNDTETKINKQENLEENTAIDTEYVAYSAARETRIRERQSWAGQ